LKVLAKNEEKNYFYNLTSAGAGALGKNQPWTSKNRNEETFLIRFI